MKNTNTSTKVITDGSSAWEFTWVKKNGRREFFISIYDIRVDEDGQSYDLIDEQRVTKTLGNKIYAILLQDGFFELFEKWYEENVKQVADLFFKAYKINKLIIKDAVGFCDDEIIENPKDQRIDDISPAIDEYYNKQLNTLIIYSC